MHGKGGKNLPNAWEKSVLLERLSGFYETGLKCGLLVVLFGTFGYLASEPNNLKVRANDVESLTEFASKTCYL
jgi:hypothetical protein